MTTSNKSLQEAAKLAHSTISVFQTDKLSARMAQQVGASLAALEFALNESSSPAPGGGGVTMEELAEALRECLGDLEVAYDDGNGARPTAVSGTIFRASRLLARLNAGEGK